MLDGPLPAAVAKPLDYDQMVFLEQHGYIPWDLLVNLFVADRIGVTNDEFVITTNDIADLLPFHFCFSQCWSVTIGSDQITLRASLDAVRAVAA
jgi:hypothetical protein